MPPNDPDIRHIEEAKLAKLLNWALDENDASQSAPDDSNRHTTPPQEDSPRMDEPK